MSTRSLVLLLLVTLIVAITPSITFSEDRGSDQSGGAQEVGDLDIVLEVRVIRASGLAHRELARQDDDRDGAHGREGGNGEVTAGTGHADQELLTRSLVASRSLSHPADATPVGLVAGLSPVQPSGVVNGNRSVEPGLRDVGDQLSHLKFQRFRLIGTQREQIGIRKRALLRLPEGESLVVRPLYREPERVGIWLKWMDAQGLEILDTRLHLAPGESMLTGTDSPKDCGTLLALKVLLPAHP